MKKLWILFFSLLIFFPKSGNANLGSQEIEASAQLRSYIQNKLQSKKPIDIAWGAYLTRKYNQNSNIPALLALAKNPTVSPETSFVLLSIFDTFIYFDVTPDVDVLIPLSKKYPILKSPSLILMIQEAFRDNSGLIESSASADKKKSKTLSKLSSALSENTEDYLSWIAIANALAENKTSGFTHQLLQNLRFEIIVYLDGPKRPGAGSGSFTSVNEGNFTSVPAGFPPTPIYSLEFAKDGESGDVLFSPGINPVIYHRKETSDSMISAETRGRKIRLDDAKIQYLTKLAEIPSELTPSYELVLKWKDLPTYKQDITFHKQKIEKSYQILLQQLVKKRRLASSDVTKFPIKIETHVLDFRLDKKVQVD